jgi:ribose 5-phosphate isomerase RpiB
MKPLKNFLRDHVKTKPSTFVIDVGVNAPDAVDYPDIAALVCRHVLSIPGSAGIVLCGSGIGISIACNKINGIRCALCHDYYTAEMCDSTIPIRFIQIFLTSSVCAASTMMRTLCPSGVALQVLFQYTKSFSIH